MQTEPNKAVVTIRLDHRIVEYYRGTGRGWQTRMNADLREIVTENQEREERRQRLARRRRLRDRQIGGRP
jgi:hypothetical protein